VVRILLYETKRGEKPVEGFIPTAASRKPRASVRGDEARSDEVGVALPREKKPPASVLGEAL